MKTVFTFLAIAVICIAVKAQTDVYFRINHKLGTANFSTGTTAQNNLGNNFQISRLDYYISEIKLIYDGGQDTVLSGTYLLVKTPQPVNAFLGSFNITTLESVEFGIGVDPGLNHSDISTYPSSHPLSFQSPSMHWGWAAGYRFVAMEGQTGAAMDHSWQVHALGDQNYRYAVVTTNGTINNGDVIIDLDADYTQALKDINVSGGLNYHGEEHEAQVLLKNFRSYVFTEATTGVGLEEEEDLRFTLAPNPGPGHTTLLLNEASVDPLTLVISDVNGRKVLKENLSGKTVLPIELTEGGLYLVQLFKNNVLVAVEKLIIARP